MSVVWKLTVGGVDIEIEQPEEGWRRTIEASSEVSAKKIAAELDRVAKERPLAADEATLRAIIREEHGV